MVLKMRINGGESSKTGVGVPFQGPWVKSLNQGSGHESGDILFKFTFLSNFSSGLACWFGILSCNPYDNYSFFLWLPKHNSNHQELGAWSGTWKYTPFFRVEFYYNYDGTPPQNEHGNWKSTMHEDVFPIRQWGFSNVMLVFSGVIECQF